MKNNRIININNLYLYLHGYCKNKHYYHPSLPPPQTLPTPHTAHVTHLERNCADALTVVRLVTQESRWTFVDAIYYTMTHVTTIGERGAI